MSLWIGVFGVDVPRRLYAVPPRTAPAGPAPAPEQEPELAGPLSN
ncbi:hypothetical protein ACFYNW_16725 [Streptomyces virginiae]